MRRPLGAWRVIFRRRYVTGYYGCNTFAGSVVLTFMCGHERQCKASKAPKGRRARCRECS